MGEQEDNVVMETETVEPNVEVAPESVAENTPDEVGANEAQTEESTQEEAVEEAPQNPNWKWYVVNSPTGHENRAKASLEDRIKQQGLEEQFGEILIPTENVVELVKGGKRKTSKRKFFPGYMLVQMELTDESWHLVKTTPKISGFVGNATQPPAVPEHEVRRLTKQIDDGITMVKPKVKFEEGENVRVIDGPFANFNGVVDMVNEDKGKVRVMVSIFGRSTPVELEFVQVEKT